MVSLSISYIKQNWLGNVRNDLLAGMVVALALIPEAIAFSIIAGVDPKVGLYASFCIAVVIALVGGRPGMISAATGAMALAMVTLVKEHGLDYLLAATILTGVLQIIAGVFKLGSLMRFVSRSVVTGFVNALAILIFMAQMDVLTSLFIEKGIPDHIRSDNGSEFTAKPIRAWLKRLGVKTLYIEPGSPWENGYNESFNGRFRDEFLKAEVLYSPKEAEVLSAQWRHLYNHIRPHSSLGYKPPAPLARAPRMAAPTCADAPVADTMRSGGKVPIGGGLQNGG